ncbi:hypothetical protein N0V90_004033 [Kalmusia sp. IMI 367209]|nr:hypothetical protein N0V90_004033 [Kalmusia sp. IMI 367209]
MDDTKDELGDKSSAATSSLQQGIEEVTRETNDVKNIFVSLTIFETILCCKIKGKPGERRILSDHFIILNTKIPGEVIFKDD